jgi:formate hydrogenlyase transcriptional activator
MATEDCARPRIGSDWLGSEEGGIFRHAAESLPTGALIWTPDGTIVLVNRRLEEQLGYSRDELIGRPVHQFLPDAPRSVDASRHGVSATLLNARRRDGSGFRAEIGLTPLQTASGLFILGSVVDISPRLEAEQASRRVVEEQLEFERLIAELSYNFINLPADQVIEAIRRALSRIGEALKVDRCSFYRIEANEVMLAPIGWSREGVEPPPVVTSAKQQFPWALETIVAGKTLCFSRTEEIPHPADRAGYEGFGIRSSVTVPLSVAGRVLGAVGFNMTAAERSWAPETLQRMNVIASIFGNVLARLEGDEGLRRAISEAERLRDQLQAENMYLRREFKERLDAASIVGQSAAVKRVLDQVRQVAATDSSVLLLGETGTGKELFAMQIHNLSGRRERTMVRVNCAAIPATLMESELFGREKGAYTGALARQIGRFELAHHSTIFLDEIGDLPAEVQVKLLRVLEERQVERLGNPKSIHVDVRIIAATHRDLEQRIADGTFREDLFYRLNVFPIRVPPLRERAEDIPLLVWRFVDEFSRAFGKRISAIPAENMAALLRYAWPGNIRELRNVVERAMILAIGSRLTITLPTSPSAASGKRSLRLTDVEKEHIRSVLESTAWRIRGPGGAADRLGLRPTTLETRMAKLGLTRPRPS